MAFWRLALFAAAVLACSSTLRAAQDEPVVVDEAQDEYGLQKFTCPVGSEQFEQNVNWVGYPLAARPDGGTLGTEFSDIIVPECPGNGLVMVPKHDGSAGDPEAFTPYAETEIAKLPALVASPEYQALRKEARFFRLYWIAKKLGRPAIQRLHLLQHISFIMVRPEQQRRYLEFFVGETDALLAGEQLDPVTRLRFTYYVGNALRQLGRFEDARKRMEDVSRIAQELRAGRLVANPGNPHFEEDRDFQEDEGLWSVAEEQLKAIAAGDTDKHPVSMMSDKIANSVCIDSDDDYPPATETTIRACAQRKIDKAREEEKWQAEFAEERRLEANPKELSRLCTKTPEGKREEALQQACYSAEYQATTALKEKDAARLLKNPKALDVQCKDVIIPGKYARSKTALGEACQKRAEMLREEQKTALADKMRKQPAEFDRLCTEEYPDMHSENTTELACYEVKEERDDVRDEAIRARLEKMTEAEIWAECEKSNDGRDGPGFLLQFRCSDIRSDREEAAWAALEADPVKLEAECAKDDTAQADWLGSRCYRREQDKTEALAFDMAKDHGKLVSACAATPILGRDAVLRQACSYYRKCLITRFDEMPYSHLQSQYTAEPPPPSQLVSTCYDSVEEANAAWGVYQKDPKSLRANGCASGVDMWGGKIDAAECARYARGEDVFASVAEGPAGLVSYEEYMKANEAGTQMDCDAIKLAEEELQRINDERETCIKKEMKERGLKYTGSDKATGYLQVWEECEALRSAKAGAEAMKE